MMRHEGKHKSRPSRRRFIIGWALIWLAAMFLPRSVASVLTGNNDIIGPAYLVVFYAVLPTLQMLWIRRYLRIHLRHWILLTILGAIAGTVSLHFLEATVMHPFPPKLWSNSSSRMPEPWHVMQLKYALYSTVYDFLRWSIPLIFQWATLRKLHQQHKLWLLAAFVCAPLTFSIGEYGGIFLGTLRFLGNALGISLIRDAQPLGSIAALLDWTTPTVIMGLLLYWLLTQSEKTKADQVRAF